MKRGCSSRQAAHWDIYDTNAALGNNVRKRKYGFIKTKQEFTQTLLRIGRFSSIGLSFVSKKEIMDLLEKICQCWVILWVPLFPCMFNVRLGSTFSLFINCVSLALTAYELALSFPYIPQWPVFNAFLQSRTVFYFTVLVFIAWIVILLSVKTLTFVGLVFALSQFGDFEIARTSSGGLRGSLAGGIKISHFPLILIRQCNIT